MQSEKPQALPTDGTFEAYLKAIAGSTVELELVSGRSVTGRINGISDDWVLVVDEEKRWTIAATKHVACVRVLRWKNEAEPSRSKHR